MTASPNLLLGKGVAGGAGVAVLCQGRWDNSQPASGQWDRAWDIGTSQCHPMKLSPQVTPHQEEQQVPRPCPQAVLLCALSKRFPREEREEMERGCGTPSFLDPPWDVFLHPWLFAAASKPRREVMPNPTEQRRLERRFPLSMVPSPCRAPGHVCPPPPPRCHWVLLAVPRGRAPEVWGLSHRHRAQQWDLPCRRLWRGDSLYLGISAERTDLQLSFF